MELIELVLNNFKKFTEADFKFCPGLNIVWGQNESGKSTLHEAVCCTLFGRERGQSVENWNGGVCRLELTYKTEDKTYRLERKLTEGISKLSEVQGDELISLSADKDQIARLVADHLGMSSRSTFENTVFVRQNVLSRPDMNGMHEVGGEIQKVLTGTANVSAGEVMKYLEESRDGIKGRARPTNPREYDNIANRLRTLAEELADARKSRTRIKSLEEEESELTQRIERDSARLATLEDLLDRHKRWSELLRRQSDINAQHEDVFSTTRRIKDTLDELTAIQKELEDYADLVGKDDEIADHLTKVDSRKTELASRIDEIEGVNENTHAARPNKKIGYLLLGWLILCAAAVRFGIYTDPIFFWLLVPAFLCLIGYIVGRIVIRTSGKHHLTKFADSARTEMEQVAAEEQNLLSFVNCRNTDQVWGRIKSYRALAAKSREKELTVDTLLNQKTMLDWEEQETGLARDLSAIKAELETEFAGYSPTTEESESWRAEFASLQNSVPRAQARLHEIRGSLDAERGNAKDLAALEGELEYLHSRKNELEFVYKAYCEAISTLSAVTTSISEEYLPTLGEKAGDHLAWVTSGRYNSLSVDSNWAISVDSKEKSGVSPSSLSLGTVDQVYLALRVASGELLSAGRSLPLILDDPFAAFDRMRLENVLQLLCALSREHQIILLTHDNDVLDWAKARQQDMDGDTVCIIHTLSGPSTSDTE